MSLRRRITAAAALAVAFVAIAVGLIGYLSTRSQLSANLHSELSALATGYLQPHHDHGPGTPPTDGDDHHAFRPPPAPELGAAPGYFQFIFPDGTRRAAGGGTPELPVDAKTVSVARTGRGSYYSTVTVRGQRVEMLTVADVYDRDAVQVALPRSSVDRVLHGLALTFVLLVVGGILAALVIGAVIARAALAPIGRFIARTEAVTSADDRSSRLEETGATELHRLAVSFNQTLDALERSVQAQRHLIADASHELRTPMAALRSNIQIFLEGHRLPPEERVELQEAIVAELDELTQLVADVLDLARGTAPGDHTEPIELDTLVQETIARTQRRAPELQFDAELEPTVIVNAPDRVARAVINVIENARKWSPPSGPVEVTLKGGVLTVRDHGPGFRETDIPYVFDRFYRAEDARRLPGSGLGLAIVKQAAEAFGGRAEVGNAPDGGAVVTVSFGTAVTAAQREPAAV